MKRYKGLISDAPKSKEKWQKKDELTPLRLNVRQKQKKKKYKNGTKKHAYFHYRQPLGIVDTFCWVSEPMFYGLGSEVGTFFFPPAK